MRFPQDPRPKSDELKIRTEAWIFDLIRKDELGGRSQGDFPVDRMAEKVKAGIDATRCPGVDVYHGGGNVFCVSYVKGHPIVTQIRPLASRRVRLIF